MEKDGYETIIIGVVKDGVDAQLKE